MENDDNTIVDPVTAGFGVAASVAIVFSTVLTVVKETNPPVLAWMKTVTLHHWVTHGLLVLGVFFLLGLLLSRKRMRIHGILLAEILIGSAFLGGLGIVFLFLFLYFN